MYLLCVTRIILTVLILLSHGTLQKKTNWFPRYATTSLTLRHDGQNALSIYRASKVN